MSIRERAMDQQLAKGAEFEDSLSHEARIELYGGDPYHSHILFHEQTLSSGLLGFPSFVPKK